MLSAAALRGGAAQAEEGALALLDRARAALLMRAARLPGVVAYRRRRGLRLLVVAVSTIAIAFLLAVLATGPLLALSPVLLGIPHVASDVRYLLAREGEARLPARALRPVTGLLLVSVACGLLQAYRCASAAGALAVLAAGLSVAAGWRARALFLGLGALAGAAVALRPAAAALALAQGHNFIAVLLAGWLVRRQLRAGWLPAALLLVAIAALAGGACDRWLGADDGAAFARTAWQDVLATASPAGLTPVVARRWVAVFAFAQAIHYSAWLRIVPDALRPSERPVSFRRSFALLGADLGGPLAARAVVLLCLALPLLACVSLDGARRAYFGFAVFHGYVELSCLATLVLARAARARAAIAAVAPATAASG